MTPRPPCSPLFPYTTLFRSRQTRDEAPKLLGCDDALRRILAARPREDLLECGFRLRGAGRRLRERDVLVQGGMLVAARGLDGRDDLPRDAELREIAEARLPVRAEVPDRLVQAQEPFLNQVVRIATQQEIRRRLQAHESAVALDDPVIRVRAAALRERDEIRILKLRWSFGAAGCGCSGRGNGNGARGGRSGHRFP